MNLDELIRKTAKFGRFEDDLFVGGDASKGAYLTDDTDATKIKNNITDALNSSIKDICRDYEVLVTSEKLKTIEIDGFSYTLHKISRIYDDNDITYRWSRKPDGVIYVSDNTTNASLNVDYTYIHDSLVNLSDSLDIPEAVVDSDIFCHAAAYDILIDRIDPISQKLAQKQMQMYQKKLSTINNNIGECVEIVEAW